MMLSVTIYAGWFMSGLMCGFAIFEWGQGKTTKMRHSVAIAVINAVAAISIALLR